MFVVKQYPVPFSSAIKNVKILSHLIQSVFFHNLPAVSLFVLCSTIYPFLLAFHLLPLEFSPHKTVPGY